MLSAMPHARRAPSLALLLCGLAAAACRSSEPTPPDAAAPQAPAILPAAAPVLAPDSCGKLQKLTVFGDIYLASQPTPEDLRLLEQRGVRTVIDLRRPQEPRGYDEADWARTLGIQYVALPFANESDLGDAIFARGRELLGQAPRPLLMHCGSSNRVGALWLAWRALDGGLTLEAAREEAKLVGLKSAALEAKAIDYVQRQR
jgi:uncharacterized protein (TIGR01244 family)